MNKNIKINFIFLLVASLGFVGCEKQLDLSPISEIGENAFYTTSDEVEGGVLAIYDGLQQVPLREFALTEMRSDNTETKSSEGDWAQFESLDVEPTNLAIGSYWKANYNVIFRANKVLEHLDVVGNDALRNQFEGEAKFARALAHFNLVRAYGDVPMVDKVIFQTDTDYFSKDAAASVLDMIDTDLTTAVALLPAKGTMENGRATSGAATALLAKVKLTKGDHSGAETLLGPMVSGTEYSLMADYNDVFYTEMNDEIIFAIPYVDDDANEGQDFSFEMTAGGAVSGLNYVTDDFKAAVDSTDVIRALTYFNPSNGNEVGKFVTVSSDARLCGNDWIVLRMADVHLMYAEAIMAGGAGTTSQAAIESYNAVRTRAGVSTLATDGTETLTKEMLLHERRVELSFENHRFYDLIRFGEAQNVLGAFALTQGYIFTSTDLLLPIPQGEINVSQGLLIQNSGY